ncbi:MAG: serine/threonine-protein kinase, partial [Limisphaerales bacterium]
MTDEKMCPHCGKPVPPTTLGGICPECMLKSGLATQTEGPHGTKVLQPPAPAEIATLFPQLEILECLGRGGMGVVYKARQPRLNRFVALKILAREKEQDAQFTERFTREAQALARLNHPNIVTVHDFGEAGGHCYLVMEFVDGLNLRQLLQARKMPSAQALTIVPKICEALQYAHEQGVVHRDIKPENILLDKSGRVKIADFGIAKMLGDEPGQQTLTGAKDAVGTPHYMAPEQIEKPLSVDHRADIYSLGVVFYEMLTGELPLGKFQPPSSKVQIDVRLDEVVLHALEKEPERRYQQASQVKTAVETIAATAPGGSPSNLNVPVQTAAQVEAARKRLKIPARGLIASVVLQLLFALGLLIFAVPGVARESGGLVGFAVIGFIVVGFLIPTAVVLAGVTNMLKLRRYTFTVVASVVAAVAGPGAILGLPFGIWACVELFRPEVRSAFATNRQPADKTIPSVPPAAQRPGHFWRFIVIGFVVIVVLGLLGDLALRNFFKARNVPQIICKTIQTEVGRQLHQAGATYDSLRVTVAEPRDSGTPFTVNYRGLRNFKYTLGGQPDPNW